MRLGDLFYTLSLKAGMSNAQSDELRLKGNQLDAVESMASSWVTANPSQISGASILAGSGNSLLDDQGLRIYDGQVLKGWWEIDGDLRTGSDISAVDTTCFSVFAVAQTYGGESINAGTVLIGSNSSGFSNIKYAPDTGQLEFRGGTTVQAYVGTDGSIVFGGGIGTLNSLGIDIIPTSVYENQRAYKFSRANGDDMTTGMYAADNTVTGVISLQLINSPAADTLKHNLLISAISSGAGADGAWIQLAANDNISNFTFVVVPSGINFGGAAPIINEFSTDTTCAGNSNTAVPTEAVLVAYTAAQIAAIPPSSGGGGCIARGLLGI